MISELKHIFYKTNKLMLRYSYIITSLPEEAQVYNNTTMSSFYSSKPITLAGRRPDAGQRPISILLVQRSGRPDASGQDDSASD